MGLIGQLALESINKKKKKEEEILKMQEDVLSGGIEYDSFNFIHLKANQLQSLIDQTSSSQKTASSHTMVENDENSREGEGEEGERKDGGFVEGGMMRFKGPCDKIEEKYRFVKLISEGTYGKVFLGAPLSTEGGRSSSDDQQRENKAMKEIKMGENLVKQGFPISALRFEI